MNKLVSKNPVQRFKLGNRIVKFQQAGKITYATRNGRLVKYDPSVGHQEYVNPNQDALNIYNKTAIFNGGGVGGGSRGVNKRTIYPLYDPNTRKTTYYNSKEEREAAKIKPKSINQILEETNTAINYLPREKRTNIPKSTTIISSKPTVVPKTSFYGQGIGGTVLARGNNFNGLISDDARNKLIATGKFDNNSFSSVQNFQTALNNYFANDGVGSITVDDKWGNQTQKAFDLALAKAGESHGQTFNPNVNQYNNTIETPLSTVSYGYTPTEKIQVTTPQRIYNREDVRDFIRSRGKNAYGFSGAQRRALRMVLNGQGTDTDRAIVSGMGIFKNGGLISRNPIKRFKLNFR